MCLVSLKEDQLKRLVFIQGLRPTYKNPDVILHNLLDECNNFRSLIADPNMIENNETRSCLKKKPEIDRSTENSQMPQPQTQQTYPNNANYKPRCRLYGSFHLYKDRPFFKRHAGIAICMDTRRNSARVINDDRIQTTGETPIKLNIAKRHCETLCINGIFLELQIGTGSEVTIVSDEAWKTLVSPKLDTVPFKVFSAFGDAVQLSGAMKYEAASKGKTAATVCHVADYDINLLRLDWIDMFNALEPKIQSVTCPQVRIKVMMKRLVVMFENTLGNFKQTTTGLFPKPGVNFVFRPKRPLLVASMKIDDNDLERTKQMGVLQPIAYFKWAGPIVVVQKMNRWTRICADFSTALNSSLEDNHYPLPISDTFFTVQNGGKFFTEVDISDAYLQVEV
ncbi:unnamed protein product [Hymenolepis diminuta]|uniref:Reverse transcriptase domain-containing protein n=1 Tax=Hymenolepis diminuta TaxID=6216 RepID=A0A564Z934_HYMDI|nr:unnamed protein product [Hymenolepis diminuta]